MYKLLILLSIFLTSTAFANNIATWTDAEGNVHYGNPQFAPAGSAEAVKVNPANGMDVPKPGVERSQKRPSVAYVKKPKKKNLKGFRGFAGRNKGARLR